MKMQPLPVSTALLSTEPLHGLLEATGADDPAEMGRLRRVGSSLPSFLSFWMRPSPRLKNADSGLQACRGEAADDAPKPSEWLCLLSAALLGSCRRAPAPDCALSACVILPLLPSFLPTE